MSSKTLLTFGLSYRFFTTKTPPCADPSGVGEVWECPMKCEGQQYGGPGKCKMCGMVLIKK